MKSRYLKIKIYIRYTYMRQPKKEIYWEKFTKKMDRDLHLAELNAWGMLRRRRPELKNLGPILRRITPTGEYTIKRKQCTRTRNLNRRQTQERTVTLPEIHVVDAIIQLKNKKAPGRANERDQTRIQCNQSNTLCR